MSASSALGRTPPSSSAVTAGAEEQRQPAGWKLIAAILVAGSAFGFIFGWSSSLDPNDPIDRWTSGVQGALTAVLFLIPLVWLEVAGDRLRWIVWLRALPLWAYLLVKVLLYAVVTMAAIQLARLAFNPFNPQSLAADRVFFKGVVAATVLSLVANAFVEIYQRTKALERSNDELGRRKAEVEESKAALEHAYAELQAAQHQLVQSEKMASLGQLVAGVAHEINNPVSFIVGNLEPLERRLAELNEAATVRGDPEMLKLIERVHHMVQTIGRGAERTAGIVQDLRTFSRVGDVERGPCDVHESLDVSVRLLRPKWDGRIAILREYGELPAIRAVPGKLNQVFMNLLANACDAIADHGTIRIGTAIDGDEIRITIADDGVGIDAEHLDRVFDPFFTTKPQGQGTGLGLSISHGIVVDHGGRLDVESRVGSGTVFSVRLPLVGERSDQSVEEK